MSFLTLWVLIWYCLPENKNDTHENQLDIDFADTPFSTLYN